MYFLGLAIKSIKRNITLYVIFGILLIILFTAVFVLLAVNSDTQSKIDAVLREYGSAYRLQENFGVLPSKEAYEKLRELPYISEVEYKKYTHIIMENNLTLRMNGIPLVQSGMLMISGLPDFDGLPELSSGVYPEDSSQCVVEDGFSGQYALGDVIFVGDGLSGTEKELEIVGIIEQQTADELLGTSNFSGSIIIATMDCASKFYSTGQRNNVSIDGIRNGWDATAYLTDYRYGGELKEFVSSAEFGFENYSAVHQKEGFEGATRNLENLSELCSVLQKIAAAISIFAVLFFVLLKTNLKTREICILRSMGMGRGKLILMTVFEYSVFILFSVLAGVLLGGTGMFFFVFERSVEDVLAVCGHSLTLILVFFLIVLAVTPFSVTVADRLSLTKTIRSTENI